MSITNEYMDIAIRSFELGMLPTGEPFTDHDRTDVYGPLHDWMRCGFPQLSPTHKLAASLCCTHSVSALELVWPWPSFFILVPDHLILVPAESSADRQGTHVAAIFVRTKSDDGQGAITPVTGTRNPVLRSPAGDRLFEMSRRLVEGCLIELEAPEIQRALQEGPRPSKRNGPPKAWTFVLRREVKVDVREEVRRYCLIGDGPSPKVQTFVRGHHRRQASGPGRTERRWIHIEPYWRGPEDAPIVVCPHSLGET